jgi:hypothetical protein
MLLRGGTSARARIVLEPDVVDAHGDIYGVEEARRAAHGFMSQSQTLGLMHR